MNGLIKAVKYQIFRTNRMERQKIQGRNMYTYLQYIQYITSYTYFTNLYIS